MFFNHTTSDGSRKTESIRQRFLMPGITGNCYEFLAWIITQNSKKFFNCGTKFNSFISEYMVFSIPKRHSSMEEIPLDLDIPQSLDSL